MMNTFFALMAEYNAAHIPVTTVAKKYFGYDDNVAKNKAAKGDYPFPVFRASGQKSPWLVSVTDLAKFLDEMRDRAARDFKH